MTYSVSAPGKMILFGEHAVVYGKMAIASSISMRTSVTISNIPYQAIEMTYCTNQSRHGVTEALITFDTLRELQSDLFNKEPELNIDILNKLDSFIAKEFYHHTSKHMTMALKTFLFYAVHLLQPLSLQGGIQCTISSEIPLGAGLGSSAAYNVALVGSLLTSHLSETHSDHIVTSRFDDTSSKDRINKWAFLGEQIIHGKASGVDNAVSVYGGILAYQNKVFEFLTPRSVLSKLRLLLVDTNVPRITSDVVSHVRQCHQKSPLLYDAYFEAIHDISLKAKSLLTTILNATSCVDAAAGAFLHLIEENQKLLELIDVSHPIAEKLLSVLQKYQAKGKWTGAGRGGCFYILVDPKTSEEMYESLKRDLTTMLHLNVYEIQLEQPGVSISITI